MRDYARLIKLIRPHRGILIIAIICMAGTSLFGGASLGAIIPFVDNIISGKGIPIPQDANIPQFLVDLIVKLNSLSPLALLNHLIIWLVVMFLLKEAFTYFQSYLMNDLSQRVIRDIKDMTYKKFLELSMDFYSKHPTGKLASKITFDATIVRDSISEGFTDLLYQPIQLLVYFVIILSVRSYFSISWSFVFIIVFLLPSIIYPVITIGRRIRKISEQSATKMGDINTALFETITGIRIVKAFSMEAYEFKKLKRHNQNFYKLMMKYMKRMIAIRPMTEFISIGCAAVIAWLGTREIVSGRLSAGAFIAFLAALLSLLKPFKRLSRVYGINQRAMAAANRIFEVLDIKPTITEVKDAVRLPVIKNNIIFDDVCFKYEDGSDVLKNINITVKKGAVIAIVGPTGVGKTTLINLIPRFYDPSSGSVKIDGIDLRKATFKSLRAQIGVVTQDMILFNDTVANNISYGRAEGVDLASIREAARIANAHDFIEKMPQGYDTVIGEKGTKLSGGEKQRLSIARAVYKDPPILIFDEATSHLDAASEKLVQEAIDRLMKGRTVFVIAHRLSTVRGAHKIIVLEDGKIVEEGTHDSLIAASGLYKRLYEIQFDK